MVKLIIHRFFTKISSSYDQGVRALKPVYFAEGEIQIEVHIYDILELN